MNTIRYLGFYSTMMLGLFNEIRDYCNRTSRHRIFGKLAR